MRALVIAALALAPAGCNGYASRETAAAASPARSPSRGECAQAVAHQWLLEDIEGLGDPVLADQAGEDLDGPPAEAEAWRMLEVEGLGGRGSAAVHQALDRCEAGSYDRASCVLRSTTAAAIRRCPK